MATKVKAKKQTKRSLRLDVDSGALESIASEAKKFTGTKYEVLKPRPLFVEIFEKLGSHPDAEAILRQILLG